MLPPLTDLHPFLQELYDDLLARLGTQAGGPDSLFPADFTVSLSNGKTFGRFPNGATVPAAGKSAVQVITDAAIEAIFPTYSQASVSLNVNIPNVGEVGETINPTFITTYNKNDAGNLIEVHINKNGALFGVLITHLIVMTHYPEQ